MVAREIPTGTPAATTVGACFLKVVRSIRAGVDGGERERAAPSFLV